MTIGLPAATVISSEVACRYGAEGKRIDDTLSREISHCNAARTIRRGDFSTPLRFGRNDGGRSPPPSSRAEPHAGMGTGGNRSDDTLSREISRRNAACTIRGGDFSTPLRCGRNDDKGVRQHRHLGRGIYEKTVSRGFILSPGWGKVRRSRIRGSRAAANHQNAYHAIWH